MTDGVILQVHSKEGMGRESSMRCIGRVWGVVAGCRNAVTGLCRLWGVLHGGATLQNTVVGALTSGVGAIWTGGRLTSCGLGVAQVSGNRRAGYNMLGKQNSMSDGVDDEQHLGADCGS